MFVLSDYKRNLNAGMYVSFRVLYTHYEERLERDRARAHAAGKWGRWGRDTHT